MVDLHVHTKYSLLDSISEPEELVLRSKELGRTALCITEHGNLYSSIEIYKLCQKHDIKYLHGCEMYICEDVNIRNKSSKYNHLVLISKNEIGRLNLIKLVTLSSNFKYYGKPRIDFNMLKQYKEGLVVISACMAGEIQRALSENDCELAKTIASKYKKEFGDDYYLEYQSHTEQTQQVLNKRIVELANEMNIKYVVTSDAHYVRKEDQIYHNIFVQIGQSREVGETYNDCYVQSIDEVINICKSTEKYNNIAIKNTHEIAEKCNVTIPLSAPIMPHVNIPKDFKSELQYLKHLCKLGWINRRINRHDKTKRLKYKERLNYEINIISEMGFEGYYLLVYGYANSVKRRGIARGSGGGSLVAYLINIVDTDPIEYGLYFERFIDVGALKLLEEGKITKSQLKIPDFDLDFGKIDRDKVMQNIINEHGIDNVASLGSFQYIWAKSAIKDIGKVLGIPFDITNEMTGNLDKETIQEALDLGLLEKYEKEYPKLFIYAKKLAGLPKSFSKHPCGKVITMNNTDYYNALEMSEDGDYVLQGDMHTAEDLGLIKVDILGLRTVDVIYDVLDMIGKDYEYIAPHNLNFADNQVLKCFKDGYTSGVFQFESNGMKRTLENIEASSLYDLAVANALFRPGSMDYIENYANRRKGLEVFEYLHNDLKSILGTSYGIIVFQEQLIEIGKLAELSNPDELRQATAKKKTELMEKIQPELFNGLTKRGWNEDQLSELWEIMLKFAKYSFNLSHSQAYAMIAYICMYLKVYHPNEFITAWINSYNGKTENMQKCITEAIRLKINLVYPNFDEVVGRTFTKNNKIYIGTESVKFLNSQIAIELKTVNDKKHKKFMDVIKDITENTSVNSRQLKILTGLNFFNKFGNNKKLLTFIEMYENLSSRKQVAIKDIEKLGINFNIFEKYVGKKTEKLYKEIDTIGYLNEMFNILENKSLSAKEQIEFEMKYLEYVVYTNDQASDEFYAVIEFKTYKDKAKPYVMLRQINSGIEFKSKVTSKKLYQENPFELFNILKVNEFREQQKTKMINGEWTKTDELEKILVDWEVY